MSTFRFFHFITALFALLIFTASISALIGLHLEAGGTGTNAMILGAVGLTLYLINLTMSIHLLNKSKIY